ncbi:hypothetical protein SAMN05421759_1094 [Roseivivax lentus]|uniref:Uncharacterized protein n=1 Tax=Roseivivax lentus TaxID=633194 RepID=A0A1N7NLT7_9RHOB|nr:hypothetical protein [Roseivivax lentus]SIS99272.1 hypothetical protein SAMN05421759_1094 [Roseivivax lentus]
MNTAENGAKRITDLDPDKLSVLRSRAAQEVETYKVNFPLRDLVRMDTKPVGKRPWIFTSGELATFNLPLDQLHALLIAYTAFEQYTGKPNTASLIDETLSSLLIWLRHARHGPVDILPLAKVDMAEFVWFAATILDIAPDVASRFYLKREANLKRLRGLAS